MRYSRFTFYSALAAILITLAAPAVAASPQAARDWEPLKSERTDAKQIVKEPEIEIKSTRGAIIVTTSRPIDIKVFTIIGRRVSESSLSPGTHQLSLPTHGIYIVKVGELTCKVAI